MVTCVIGHWSLRTSAEHDWPRLSAVGSRKLELVSIRLEDKSNLTSLYRGTGVHNKLRAANEVLTDDECRCIISSKVQRTTMVSSTDKPFNISMHWQHTHIYLGVLFPNPLHSTNDDARKNS